MKACRGWLMTAISDEQQLPTSSRTGLRWTHPCGRCTSLVQPVPRESLEGCRLFPPCQSDRSRRPPLPKKARGSPPRRARTPPTPTQGSAGAGTTTIRAAETFAASTGMCVKHVGPQITQRVSRSVPNQKPTQFSPLLTARVTPFGEMAQGRASRTELPPECRWHQWRQE